MSSTSSPACTRSPSTVNQLARQVGQATVGCGQQPSGCADDATVADDQDLATLVLAGDVAQRGHHPLAASS